MINRNRIVKIAGNRILVSIVWVVLLCACSDSGVIYHSFNHLPERGWDKREIQRFSPEIEDTLGIYDINVSLRYTNDYVYSNLWLFIVYTDGDGKQHIDTLECRLADVYGKWYGSGWGPSYQQEIPFKKKVHFSAPGKYPILIQQGMREDVIQNIKDVGIKVTRIQETK